MSEVELTVKGDIEVLRLMPADVVVVHFDRDLPRDEADEVGQKVRRILVAAGHDNEVMLVSKGVRIGVDDSDE